MSVAKLALPSAALLVGLSNPNAFSCAFQTATSDWFWIVDPLGRALKVVSPGAASATRSALTVE